MKDRDSTLRRDPKVATNSWLSLFSAVLLTSLTVSGQKSPDLQVSQLAPGSSRGANPQVSADSEHVYVVWEDHRNDPSPPAIADVYFNRSTDGGRTWPASDIRLDTGIAAGTFSSNWPKLASVGDAVYVVWDDTRNTPAGALTAIGDIYFNRSLDGGVIWLASDLRLDTDAAGSGVSEDAQVAVSGDGMFVAWRDDRDGSGDVRFNRSADSGATWLASDFRLDAGTPGAAVSTNPQVTASGYAVYAVWEDQRGGLEEPYFNIPFGVQPYGSGLPGAGGFTPQLERNSGFPLIGSPVTLLAYEGLGGAPGALILGATGEIAVPAFGGTLLVAPPLGSIPFGMLGAAGVPGAGVRLLVLNLPPLPSLIGASLNMQGAYLDAAAVFGISFTRGLEMWIG